MDVSPIHIAAGAGGLIFVVAVARWAYARLTTRDERAMDERVRGASLGGDFRRAGDLQAQRGRFQEAARLYTQGGEHGRAGRALLRVGDGKGAADAFEKAGEHARAAEIFREAGNHLRAAEAFARCEGREDRLAAGECFAAGGEHLKAARSFQEAGEFEKAADAYSRVPKLEPPDLALTMLENAAIGLPRDDARRRKLFGRAGEVAFNLGQHERAARGFDEAGEAHRAATLYENALKRFDLAAALYAECGDESAYRRAAEAAPSRLAVLEVREARARERGDRELAKKLREQIAKERGEQATAVGPDASARAANAGPKGKLDPRSADASSRYEILGELGRGGMGVVYRAKDRLLDRSVALKFVPTDIDPDSPAVAVFRREARSAAALSHPGIVTIYDFGLLDGREFIAMEMVEGTTLDDLIQHHGPMQAMESVDVMEKVLEAVAFAHGKGVIHRDLKPSNIMKLKSGGVKVMDFGLAKIVGAKATRATVMGGTPAYMPPEQDLGTADHRSDVFALGATYYELLTGQLPGTATEPASRASSYPSPRERVAAVPARLSDAIMRCLEQDPTVRMPDVVSLLSEIRAVRQAIISELRAFVRDEPARGAPTHRVSGEAPPVEEEKKDNKGRPKINIVEIDTKLGERGRDR